MTPSERERRIEAGMRAWLPLGSPLPDRRVVASILDAADEAVPPVDLPERTSDRAYDLRQRLDRAVRYLRDAEDIARIEMPAWPTADRVRSIYEQITEDVLNGKVSVPPIRERAERAEAAARDMAQALSDIDNNRVRHPSAFARNVLARHPSFSGEEGTEG